MTRLGSWLIALCVSVVAPASALAQRVVSEDETLKGQNSIAVRAVVEGMRDIPAATFRADIERRLRENGITVRENGYPQLTLRLNTLITSDADTRYVVFALELEWVQTLPIPALGATGAVAEAATWHRGTFGILKVVDLDRIRTSADGLTREFLGSYLTANPGAVRNTSLANPKVYTVTNRAGFGSFPRDRDDENLVLKQLEALIASKQQIIQCHYKRGDGFVEYDFWYRTPPPGIGQILKSLHGNDDHPFDVLGVNAVQECPATPEVARKVQRDSRGW